MAFNVNSVDPDQPDGYFVAHDDMITFAKKIKEVVWAMNMSTPALKAMVGQAQDEEEVEEEEEMTWKIEIDVNLAFFVKKYMLANLD